MHRQMQYLRATLAYYRHPDSGSAEWPGVTRGIVFALRQRRASTTALSGMLNDAHAHDQSYLLFTNKCVQRVIQTGKQLEELKLNQERVNKQKGPKPKLKTSLDIVLENKYFNYYAIVEQLKLMPRESHVVQK